MKANRIRSWLIAAALALLLPTAALASQGSCVLPTSGTVSGLTLVQDINTCITAMQTANSGATAPTNVGPTAGMLWYDTSTGFLKIYDGASWLPLGHIDTSGHFWNAPIGGGTNTVVSATTTDLCSVSQAVLTISGSTTITSFSNTCQTGQIKALLFSGALTLTHNASSMILPNNGSNITTVSGDRAWAVYLGSGNWEVLSYQKADGTALSASAVFTGAVFFDSPISVTLGVSTDNWAPTGLSAANVIRLTASSVINITGLTAPATDGKIVVVDNVGAVNNFVFTSQDSSSTAANRFAFDRPMTVRPGRSIAIKYDLTSARWRALQEITTQPVAGGFKTLVITNDPTNSTTLKNNMLVTADELTLEDVNGGAVRVSSVSCSIDITASGAGGLDTGTVASGTWYYEWVIFNPTTNTTSCVGSLQSAAASITKPSGYTFVARVGANYTNATSTGANTGCTFNSANSACFSRIKQLGRRAQYVVTATSSTALLPPASVGVVGSFSSTTPTFASVSLSGLVPATASEGFFLVATNYKAAGLSGVQLAPNTSYGGAINASGNVPFYDAGGSITIATVTPVEMILEATSVGFTASAAGGALLVSGWVDNL